MYFGKIKKIEKDTLAVYLNDAFCEEFSEEFLFGEEFSAELISSIRKKYPKFKKGTVRLMAGAVMAGMIQVCGNDIVSCNKNTVYASQITEEKRLAMSYIYFGTPASQISQIKKVADKLDTVSPSYFDISPEGNLEITSLYSGDVVDTAHSLGMKVMPFLSNHWDRNIGEAALSNAESLTSQIVSAVKNYGFDGVNIDIENLTHKHRDKFTAFVRTLRLGLPAEKELSVSVAANPDGINTGWQGSYDYKNLAEFCDYLIIMAYDEHYKGSRPGAVASIQFTENAIKYALKHVSSEKIVLAMPFYGRYWKDGEQGGGNGISLTAAMQLIKNYTAVVSYDKYTKTPSATVTIKNDDEKPTIGGQTLDAGTYTLHFENGISIREKLLLTAKYNLRGNGSWSLGQEPDEIWDFYTKWANGVYFADIAPSWAREEIMDTVMRGEMKGVNSSFFEPERGITRAEFITLILRKFNISVNENLPNRFKDTATHWAKAEINTAASSGIVFGNENKKFLPDKIVTRQEACSILRRVMNIQFSGNVLSFADVSVSNPAYADIAAVCKIGLFGGFPDGTFRPSQGITRAEAAAVMCRIP